MKPVTVLWFLITLLFAARASADAECVKGYRDTTADERSTMTRVLEAAKAALPLAPNGWIIGGYEEVSVRQSTCMDDESTPWSYGITRTYNRTDNVEEREAAEQAIGAEVRATQAANQPRIDALMARNQELGSELAAAAERGDQARIDEINREIEIVAKQFEALLNESNFDAQAERLAAATMQDVEMSAHVAVNSLVASDAAMQRIAPPAGADDAFAWQVTSGGVTRGHVLVLLGTWRARAAGGVELVRRGDASPSVPRAVSIHVTADPARVDGLLAGIDLRAIGALLR